MRFHAKTAYPHLTPRALSSPCVVGMSGGVSGDPLENTRVRGLARARRRESDRGSGRGVGASEPYYPPHTEPGGGGGRIWVGPPPLPSEDAKPNPTREKASRKLAAVLTENADLAGGGGGGIEHTPPPPARNPRTPLTLYRAPPHTSQHR